jgi:prepilin-type N-terminal cleavage/methylation domain-containing protein
MQSRRSSRQSRLERRGGFSLLELLVTVGVAGVTLAGATHFLAVQAHDQRQTAYRLESEQAIRSSLDAITRDLRLAGACLPTDGQFIALDGNNIPGGDSITIRTGLVRTNMSCIVTSLSAVANAGTSVVVVGSANGFATDMLGYIRHPNGSGEIKPIAGVGANSVTFAAALSQDYPIGSGVYALDERVYALDKTTPAVPLLTLAVNRGAPEAFAAGMNDLQVKYILNRNCTPCDQIDLPANTAEWRLVNSVTLTATVKTVGGVQAQDQATLVASSMAKPRNLLP